MRRREGFAVFGAARRGRPMAPAASWHGFPRPRGVEHNKRRLCHSKRGSGADRVSRPRSSSLFSIDGRCCTARSKLLTLSLINIHPRLKSWTYAPSSPRSQGSSRLRSGSGKANSAAMFRVLIFLVSLGARAIRAMCRRRADLVIENLALRQQVTALEERAPATAT